MPSSMCWMSWSDVVTHSDCDGEVCRADIGVISNLCSRKRSSIKCNIISPSKSSSPTQMTCYLTTTPYSKNVITNKLSVMFVMLLLSVMTSNNHLANSTLISNQEIVSSNSAVDIKSDSKSTSISANVNHNPNVIMMMPSMSLTNVNASDMANSGSNSSLKSNSSFNLTPSTSASNLSETTSTSKLSKTTTTLTILQLCPQACQCKFGKTNTSITTDCSNANLTSLPSNVSHLTEILIIANSRISYLPPYAFRNITLLTVLEIKGNPIEEYSRNAFSHLPKLKKLTLSETRRLRIFPDFTGSNALEHLRIDRGELTRIPHSFCDQVPHLKSLIIKSNRISILPKLAACRELKLLDLSYNHISNWHAFGDVTSLQQSFSPFQTQTKLIDLFLGHNLLIDIPERTFEGLKSLKVLDLVNNKITSIHPQVFLPLMALKDLNLGNNAFSSLPTAGLENLTQIKVYGNPYLTEFPPPEAFPKVHTLALSYAYHCCEYIGRSLSATDNNLPSLQESIVWLEREDLWDTNVTDIWPQGYANFSSKFEEFANDLYKAFGKDYVIPDNLAEYAEQYFDDYKHLRTSEDGSVTKFPVQCLPKPGSFMPCKDLFDWWTLRCGVWIVFLLALLGNVVVVVVLLFGRSQLNVPRFLVCNLAMADFFMGVYLGILAVVDASTLGEFKMFAISWQTSWGCQLAGFLGVLSSQLSVFTLAVITLERNYAITNAMHLNKRLTLEQASYIMAFGWTFAFCTALMPLFGVSDYRKFAVCLPFEIEDSPWSLAYVVFLILFNGLAFLILMGCYLRMYCAIRGSQAWNSNDSRIAKRMALLVFTDFLCWAPIAFFSLTAVSGLHLISLEEAKVFTIFVLPLNSCANPFLYAIFTKHFKKDCTWLCKRIEESKVTRGIGRFKHSSNFSKGLNPGSHSGAGDHAPQMVVCQCNIHGTRAKASIEEAILISSTNPKTTTLGWRERALGWFKHKNETQNSTIEYSNPNSQNQRSTEKGRDGMAPSLSDELFTSRSDSWNKANLQMRLIDRTPSRNQHHPWCEHHHSHLGGSAGMRGRRYSWNVTRKTSQESRSSCSRQDSSTSTFRLSRSSVSSDSSSRQTQSSNLSSGSAGPSGTQRELISPDKKLAYRRLSSIDNKPQLCRQTAVEDRMNPGRVSFSRSPPFRRESIGVLCQNCARIEVKHHDKSDSSKKNISTKQKQFKSKELEEKFNYFCNKLAETSQEETSDGQDQAVFSSDQSTDFDRKKMDFSTQSKDTAETSLGESVGSPRSIKRVNDIVIHNQTSSENEYNKIPIQKRSMDNEIISKEFSENNNNKTVIKQHISSENMLNLGVNINENMNDNKSHSMSNIIGAEASSSSSNATTNISNQLSKSRKVASDNSLKMKLSIRNLPSMLRSLSSQSNHNLQGKKKFALFPSSSQSQSGENRHHDHDHQEGTSHERVHHVLHRSAESMMHPRVGHWRHSFDASQTVRNNNQEEENCITTQIAENIIANERRRRATSHDIYDNYNVIASVKVNVEKEEEETEREELNLDENKDRTKLEDVQSRGLLLKIPCGEDNDETLEKQTDTKCENSGNDTHEDGMLPLIYEDNKTDKNEK